MTPWRMAGLAGLLFAVDPVGLRGLVLRAGPGSVRDRWLELLLAQLADGRPVRRIPATIEDDRLLGGLDLAETLKAGRPVARAGLLAEIDGGVGILAMAERLSDASGARIAAALDRRELVIARDGLALTLPARFGLVALDEGASPEEQPPPALLERLAFRIDLSVVSRREAEEDWPAVDCAAARSQLAQVEAPSDAILSALCETAAALGVASVVPPMLALRAARAAAALDGRTTITLDDATLAAQLVLAPRATQLPAPPEDEEPPPPEDPPADQEPQEPPPEPPEDLEQQLADAADIVLEATRAAIPEKLLDELAKASGPRRSGALARGQGAKQKAARRGRPLGVRSGELRAGARLSLVDTLRAAAPWQPVRRREKSAQMARIDVRKGDFRIKRFVQRQESTLIFVVDASGSAAFQRLAEVKGAIELLLAQAYVARTQVALIAFRGERAELLLPPTRSLVRARKSLAELPGGGPTPLAAGLDMALVLAMAEQAKGRTPLVLLLTDGKANVARDGTVDRAAGLADAQDAARHLARAGLRCVFVDTARWPGPANQAFAAAMAARYAPLPYVDAGAMRDLARSLSDPAPA